MAPQRYGASLGAFGMRSERLSGRPSSARRVFHASWARPGRKANTTERWPGRCSKWPGRWGRAQRTSFQDGVCAV